MSNCGGTIHLWHGEVAKYDLVLWNTFLDSQFNLFYSFEPAIGRLTLDLLVGELGFDCLEHERRVFYDQHFAIVGTARVLQEWIIPVCLILFIKLDDGRGLLLDNLAFAEGAVANLRS